MPKHIVEKVSLISGDIVRILTGEIYLIIADRTDLSLKDLHCCLLNKDGASYWQTLSLTNAIHTESVELLGNVKEFNYD